MRPTFACLPVLMFFSALGLLAAVVVLVGAYNRTEADDTPKVKGEWTWQWAAAIVITIVVPLAMLLLIWLSPSW